MANYAIMRIEKRKIGGVTKICNHHERLKEKYKSNPDIDTQKSNLTYHIKKPEDEKNIISAVVHMDETNPHMQIVFVPLT